MALTESDIFWNTTDTGWVKAAWTLFSAWPNGACIFVHELPRVDAKTILNVRKNSQCWDPKLCTHWANALSLCTHFETVILYNPKQPWTSCLLHLSPKGWGYNCMPPCRALEHLFLFLSWVWMSEIYGLVGMGKCVNLMTNSLRAFHNLIPVHLALLMLNIDP